MEHTLESSRRQYLLGNPRGFENPPLLAFGILWFREHNFQADRIRALHPEYNDERLYNEARKWVIALHQVRSWFTPMF